MQQHALFWVTELLRTNVEMTTGAVEILQLRPKPADKAIIRATEEQMQILKLSFLTLCTPFPNSSASCAYSNGCSIRVHPQAEIRSVVPEIGGKTGDVVMENV